MPEPATEIHIGLDFQAGRHITVCIDYALVKFDATWLMVNEDRGDIKNCYISRILNDKISVFDGFLIIQGSDIIATLQGGYVLGTISHFLTAYNKKYAI